MKYKLIILLCIIHSYALSVIPANLTCNKIPITMQVAESTIENNCIADAIKTEDTNTVITMDNRVHKVKFIADNEQQYICSYKQNTLIKCNAYTFGSKQ